jgi:hypothetical protein
LPTSATAIRVVELLLSRQDVRRGTVNKKIIVDNDFMCDFYGWLAILRVMRNAAILFSPRLLRGEAG